MYFEVCLFYCGCVVLAHSVLLSLFLPLSLVSLLSVAVSAKSSEMLSRTGVSVQALFLNGSSGVQHCLQCFVHHVVSVEDTFRCAVTLSGIVHFMCVC